MPAAYSMDLRQRVVDAYKPGETTYQAIAQQFSLGVASVNRWLSKKRRTGSVAPAAHGGGPVRQIRGEGKQLLAWSKVKAIVRKLKPRALDALVEPSARALECITSSDLANWFRHAGYAS